MLAVTCSLQNIGHGELYRSHVLWTERTTLARLLSNGITACEWLQCRGYRVDVVSNGQGT